MDKHDPPPSDIEQRAQAFAEAFGLDMNDPETRIRFALWDSEQPED